MLVMLPGFDVLNILHQIKVFNIIMATSMVSYILDPFLSIMKAAVILQTQRRTRYFSSKYRSITPPIKQFWEWRVIAAGFWALHCWKRVHWGRERGEDMQQRAKGRKPNPGWLQKDCRLRTWGACSTKFIILTAGLLHFGSISCNCDMG